MDQMEATACSHERLSCKRKNQETTERLPVPWWCRLKKKTPVRLRMRWKQPMMTGDIAVDAITFISSLNIKFLISGTGHKVPISFLEGKVVGLFFYGPWIPTRVFFELAYMYEKLREMGQNFEIVFVCLHNQRSSSFKSHQLSYEKSVENRFDKYFQGYTWLALPFSHRKSNWLLYEWDGFRKHGESKSDFVIIQPRQNIAYTRPMDVFKEYGIQAYPFSKSIATEFQVARLKSLTLDQVLFSGADEKFVYDQDGQKISSSVLVGKNILLFFTASYGFDQPHELVYEKVIRSHIERKCRDKSFEMLNVLHESKYERDQIIEDSKCPDKKMSCFKFPNDKYGLEALYSKLPIRSCGSYDGIYDYIPMFVAFGEDGRFITMRIFPNRFGLAYKDVDYDRLNLFSADDLYAQVSDYIATVKSW